MQCCSILWLRKALQAQDKVHCRSFWGCKVWPWENSERHMGGRDSWGGGREEDSFRWQSFGPRRLGDWQCSGPTLLLAAAGVVTITAVSASRLAKLRNARLATTQQHLQQQQYQHQHLPVQSLVYRCLWWERSEIRFSWSFHCTVQCQLHCTVPNTLHCAKYTALRQIHCTVPRFMIMGKSHYPKTGAMSTSWQILTC